MAVLSIQKPGFENGRRNALTLLIKKHCVGVDVIPIIYYIVTCRVVHATYKAGMSSDDWIY
jgi:hypothetical protein